MTNIDSRGMFLTLELLSARIDVRCPADHHPSIPALLGDSHHVLEWMDGDQNWFSIGQCLSSDSDKH